MKRVKTAVTAASSDPSAGTAALTGGAAATGAATTAAAAGAAATGAGVTAGAGLVPRLAGTTYPVVTTSPCCSASAHLNGVTATPLMPVIPLRNGTRSPATPYSSRLPVLGFTRQ